MIEAAPSLVLEPVDGPLTVAAFRAHFHPDFPEADEARPDGTTNYGAPDDRVEAAIRSARGEYALDGGAHREALLHLVAHRLVVDGADPAAVDHGAGIVTASGAGNSAVSIDVEADPDLGRTKYGRQHKRLRDSLVAGW